MKRQTSFGDPDLSLNMAHPNGISSCPSTGKKTLSAYAETTPACRNACLPTGRDFGVQAGILP